jgi:LysM repeat protein
MKKHVYRKFHFTLLQLFFLTLVLLLWKCYPASAAAGNFVNIGTAGGTDGSSDAVSWSTAFPLMIDAYGKYIVMAQRTSGSQYVFEYSNDNLTWNETGGTGLGIRVSTVYDPVNDKIHVIQANASSVKYYRYKIVRDKNYNIQNIILDSTLTSMTLDSIGSCTSYASEYPLVQLKANGANGILVVGWSVKKTCSGVTVTETRASMRVLSNTSADGTAGNWLALNGVDDAGTSTGPASVAFNKLYSYAGSTTLLQHSLFIRGGSGAKSNDLYYVSMDENNTHGFRRLSWNSGSANWSGSWTSRATFGGNIDNTNGYGAKNELMSKLVYDSVHDRVYIGIARWLNNTAGDTQSLYYMDASDSVNLAGDVYSAGGAAWFAPTMDIMYNQDDQKLYYFFETSAKDPNTGLTNTALNGKGYYKTYDGSSLSSATSFFLNSGYTIDIPIVYQSATQGRILLFFRADGAETPFVPPHNIYWGYLNSGGSLSPSPLSISSPYTASTYSNFDKICTTKTDTELTDNTDGEVSLASSFRDDFPTPLSPYTSLSSLWTTGTWSAGSFVPLPTGSVNVWGTGGAYMYGNSTFNKKTLEFRAKFTNNNFEHIGWDDGNTFGTFIMFSTASNGQLNARVNGTTYTLGTAYYDSYHTYKITWGTNDIKFFIDGVQVATDASDIIASLNPIISNNTTTAGADLFVDWINVVNYPTTTGTYVSCGLDSGTSGAVWGAITYAASTSGVTVKTRTSSDNTNWTSWSTGLSTGDTVPSNPGQYLQYQLALTGTATVTPTVDTIGLTFSAPVPTAIPTAVPSSNSISPAISSTTLAPQCTDKKPLGTPDVFQINAGVDSAVVYFSPVSDGVTSYFLAFGYTSGDQRFGLDTQKGASTGVLAYQLQHLSPNTTYYLRARSGNGCMPGDWGNEMKFITGKNNSSRGTVYYKNLFSRVISIFPRTVTNISTVTNASAVSTKPGGCTTYTVSSGDSLWNIAAEKLGNGSAYGVLMKTNGLSVSMLHPGQKLKINC